MAPHPNSLMSIVYLCLCRSFGVAHVILFVAAPPFTIHSIRVSRLHVCVPLCHKLSMSRLFVLTTTCGQSRCHCRCWCQGKLHVFMVPLRSHFLLLSYFAIFGFPLCSWFLCIVCFLCLHASKMLKLYRMMWYAIWNNGSSRYQQLKKQQERFQLLHDVLCLCFSVNPTSLL